MGTRHLIAVQYNGEYKIAQYGQWDGYPSAQGVEVLKFISNNDYLEKLKSKLPNVRFIDDEKDKDFIESYNKSAPEYPNNLDSRTPEQKMWYESYMSRNLGFRILENIANSQDKEILLNNRITFAADSLFCEYAYVVDLDSETFEIYRGFQKSPPAQGERFANLEVDKGSEYFQVTLVKKYDLSNLPTREQFLDDLTKKEEDE